MLSLLDNEGGEKIAIEADFRQYCLNQNQRYAYNPICQTKMRENKHFYYRAS